MTRILVPTDFSPNAAKALNYAVHLARALEGRLTLVHALSAVGIGYEENMALMHEQHQIIAESAQQNLSLLQQSIAETEKIEVDYKLYTGVATDTIVQAAQDLGADYIVMGTLGSAGVEEKLFGSVSAGVIGKSDIPVLIIPLLAEWNPPAEIALATHHFEDSDMTYPLFRLARCFQSRVHLVVFTDKDSSYADEFTQNERDLAAYEEATRKRYPDISMTSSHRDGHTFLESIEAYINEQGIEMLGMITHKRNFFERIFHKSLTKKMSYHTRIPLLAIPER